MARCWEGKKHLRNHWDFLFCQTNPRIEVDKSLIASGSSRRPNSAPLIGGENPCNPWDHRKHQTLWLVKWTSRVYGVQICIYIYISAIYQYIYIYIYEYTCFFFPMSVDAPFSVFSFDACHYRKTGRKSRISRQDCFVEFITT